MAIVRIYSVVHCDEMYDNSIVIWLSKIRDRDWSHKRHMICTNNHYWLVQRSMLLPVNITSSWFLVWTL